MGIDMFSVKNDGFGKCVIDSASLKNDGDVQSAAASNLLRIHGPKMPGGAFIMGVVVTGNEQGDERPPTNIRAEGVYEYIKLGQTIRKTLVITDWGTFEMIRPPDERESTRNEREPVPDHRDARPTPSRLLMTNLGLPSLSLSPKAICGVRCALTSIIAGSPRER